MSDYEGEWEPLNNRAQNFAPVKPLPVPPNPAYNYIVPKGRTLQEADQVWRESRAKSRKSSAVALPQEYRTTLQAFIPAINQGLYSSQDARSGGTIRHVQKKVQSLPAHHKYRANFDNPDDIFSFSRSIKNLTAALPKSKDSLPAQEIFLDRLANICLATNTFIVKSETNDHACNIWGDLDAVDRARDALHAFERSLTESANVNKPRQAWNKVGAFDGRVEHRNNRDQMTSWVQKFSQEQTDASARMHQFDLYWPDGYDLDKFMEDYGEDVLQGLMDKYDCVIRRNPQEPIIRVAGDVQQTVFMIHNRLTNLLREMIARQNPGRHATQCEVPSVTAHRDRVELISLNTSHGRLNMPALTGRRVPFSEQEKWTQLSSDINKKYRNATKKALSSCIGQLHTSRKHLQLRVIFGDFGLIQVMRAKHDTYEFAEFLEKVQKSGTKVLQCPLETGKSFQLIDNIESLEEFQPLEISWEVWFEFSGGPNAHKRLQLVKEYVPNVVDPDEPSVAATRWLTFDDTSLEDNSDILSINHIDMEKCGYHLHLDGATIFQSQKTSHANHAFESTVKFRPSMNGLRYHSVKHVTHAYGNQDLTDVREVTVAKYKFKETRGTFEIRRTDHFNARPGESSPVSTETEWTATYYYAGWDSLLSDFANIDPGQEVEWTRGLKTFFPQTEDTDNPQVLPRGFKKFMKEVEEIQTLISRALKSNNITTPTTNHTDGPTNGGAR